MLSNFWKSIIILSILSFLLGDLRVSAKEEVSLNGESRPLAARPPRPPPQIVPKPQRPPAPAQNPPPPNNSSATTVTPATPLNDTTTTLTPTPGPNNSSTTTPTPNDPSTTTSTESTTTTTTTVNPITTTTEEEESTTTTMPPITAPPPRPLNNTKVKIKYDNQMKFEVATNKWWYGNQFFLLSKFIYNGAAAVVFLPNDTMLPVVIHPEKDGNIFENVTISFLEYKSKKLRFYPQFSFGLANCASSDNKQEMFNYRGHLSYDNNITFKYYIANEHGNICIFTCFFGEKDCTKKDGVILSGYAYKDKMEEEYGNRTLWPSSLFVCENEFTGVLSYIAGMAKIHIVNITGFTTDRKATKTSFPCPDCTDSGGNPNIRVICKDSKQLIIIRSGHPPLVVQIMHFSSLSQNMPSDPDVNEMDDADGIQINAFGNITIFDPKPLQLYWPGFEPPPLPSTTTAKPTTTTSKPIGITKPNQNQAPTKSPIDPRKTKFVNVKYEPRPKSSIPMYLIGGGSLGMLICIIFICLIINQIICYEYEDDDGDIYVSKNNNNAKQKDGTLTKKKEKKA